MRRAPEQCGGRDDAKSYGSISSPTGEWSDGPQGMKVRLTRKLANLMNGVDLSKVHTGDTLDLSPRDALTLIAEGWAAPVLEGAIERDRAHDRTPAKGPGGARSPKKR